MATPEMKCTSCIYFKANDMAGTTGECRRYPPTVVFDSEEAAFLSSFPTIDYPQATYCGDCTVPAGDDE